MVSSNNFSLGGSAVTTPKFSSSFFEYNSGYDLGMIKLASMVTITSPTIYKISTYRTIGIITRIVFFTSTWGRRFRRISWRHDYCRHD